MAKSFSLQILFSSPGETAAFAAIIAPLLSPGDTLLLSGEVGAGKTHFARALIQTRLSKVDVTEDIPSPTYTLVQTYSDGVCDIWHADLYRLSDAAEVIELGLIDAFEDAICLVEWPDQLAGYRPEYPLDIEFSAGALSDTRAVTFKGNLPNWTKVYPLLRAKAAHVTSSV